MTETPPLLAFLHARLDDDEEVALGVSRRHWMRDAISCVVDATDNGLIVYGEGTPTSEQADHIARHDPDRVLREVAAKRAILDLHEWQVSEYTGRRTPDGPDVRVRVEFCECQAPDGLIYEPWPCVTLKLLALPHDQHPDFREEWRVDQ